MPAGVRLRSGVSWRPIVASAGELAGSSLTGPSGISMTSVGYGSRYLPVISRRPRARPRVSVRSIPRLKSAVERSSPAIGLSVTRVGWWWCPSVPPWKSPTGRLTSAKRKTAFVRRFSGVRHWARPRIWKSGICRNKHGAVGSGVAQLESGDWRSITLRDFYSVSDSSWIAISRILYFWTLPVTVFG